MERTDKLNQLRQFNRPWEYDCCDIAEKLVELSNLPDDGQLKNELTDALYYLKAVAENPYNSDYHRVLFNVLLVITFIFMVSNFSKRSVNIVEVLNMKTCKICGCSFDEENFEGVVVNEGIDNEYHVCCDCVPSECNNGHIISCEACGSYFSADKLHDEEIEGHSFTACPACGKDVVEGLSRAEFEDEYFRPRYSVVVRQFSGSVRGYIVSANSRHEVMKRLLEKLDFNYVAEVSIGEILVKEDEF
jgi:hypothetical protein